MANNTSKQSSLHHWQEKSWSIKNQSATVAQSLKLKKIYSRPNITSKDILSLEKVKEFVIENTISEDVVEQTEIQIKYSGYISKEKLNAEKLQNLENS